MANKGSGQISHAHIWSHLPIPLWWGKLLCADQMKSRTCFLSWVLELVRGRVRSLICHRQWSARYKWSMSPLPIPPHEKQVVGTAHWDYNLIKTFLLLLLHTWSSQFSFKFKDSIIASMYVFICIHFTKYNLFHSYSATYKYIFMASLLS